MSVATTHVYEVRPRKDHRGLDLISDALPFDSAVVRRAKRSQQCNRLREISQSITQRCDSRLHEAGNVIETHEHRGDFKEW